MDIDIIEMIGTILVVGTVCLFVCFLESSEKSSELKVDSENVINGTPLPINEIDITNIDFTSISDVLLGGCSILAMVGYIGLVVATEVVGNFNFTTEIVNEITPIIIQEAPKSLRYILFDDPNTIHEVVGIDFGDIKENIAKGYREIELYNELMLDKVNLVPNIQSTLMGDINNIEGNEEVMTRDMFDFIMHVAMNEELNRVSNT